jgi:hypothetical protein
LSGLPPPVQFRSPPLVVQQAAPDPMTQPLVQAASTNSLAQPQQPLTQPAVALESPDQTPERGSLRIHERRTWRTWQMVVLVLIAALVGMWFNGNAGTASGNGSGSGSKGAYKLPPASGSSSPGASPHAGAPSGSTTTTAAGGSTTTTAAGGSTSSSTATQTGPPTVLVPETQQSGNWTSAVFNIAGGQWNIGWAFQCTPAPAASPTFAIYVVNAGGSPGTTPAVSSAVASGQSVTPQSSTGSQQVIVQTAASCRWAVKVTGFSG